ncbi:unnamed protein product, partial [Prorocentrum cordatum]
VPCSGGVQLFLAPRYLKDSQHVYSMQVEVTRSVVAGSAHGVSFGKLYIRPPLQQAHVMCPRAGLWSFTDDAVTRCEGSATAAEEGLPRMAKVLKDGMSAQELICSCKTVLAASNSEPAASLSDSPAAMGTPHPASDNAVDLGIDTASGRCRVRTKASARIAAAARRWRRIMKLRRATARPTECRGLWATGTLPQSVYGHQVSGAPPGLVPQLRRRAGHAVAGAARGRCLASVLAAAVGLHDPRIALRVQLVASWRSLWFSDASLRGRIKRPWPRTLGAPRRAGKWRWRRVRGPMGALQATLLDVGWDPRAAAGWGRPTAEGVDDLRLLGAADDSSRACAGFGGALVRRIWQCPANVGEEFESTAAHVPRAFAGHEALPAMRLRGAPASCATTPVFCDQRAKQAAVSLGADSALESTRRDDGFAVVCGDGSVGKCSDDPRRRRSATIIAAMGQDEDGLWTDLRLFRAVPAPGRWQTVPRAEILGFALALESVGGNVGYVTDHEPLWRCWEQSMSSVLPG